MIGGGPAGLMAAEVLSRAGHAVHLFDAMPSVGRKFLLAGKGGMNLTHAEPLDAFVAATPGAPALGPLLRPSVRRPCATGRLAWASPPSSAVRSACSRPT